MTFDFEYTAKSNRGSNVNQSVQQSQQMKYAFIGIWLSPMRLHSLFKVRRRDIIGSYEETTGRPIKRLVWQDADYTTKEIYKLCSGCDEIRELWITVKQQCWSTRRNYNETFRIQNSFSWKQPGFSGCFEAITEWRCWG